MPHGLCRIHDRRIVAGVAAGIAQHLGISVLAVRIVFVLLIAFAQLGIVLYAVFWMLLTWEPVGRRASYRGPRIIGGSALIALAILGGGFTVAVFLASTGVAAAMLLGYAVRQARGERVSRAQKQQLIEREIALQDQTLQTLALIQRQAENPPAVRHLVSAQESSFHRMS